MVLLSWSGAFLKKKKKYVNAKSSSKKTTYAISLNFSEDLFHSFLCYLIGLKHSQGKNQKENVWKWKRFSNLDKN